VQHYLVAGSTGAAASSNGGGADLGASMLGEGSGATLDDEVRTLVRPCGDSGRGWRREALAREEMLE
jgi:hypothetical protein